MASPTRTVFVIVGVLALAAAGGYFYLESASRDGARAAASSSARPPVPVTVAVAETRDVPVLIRGLGNVQAYKTVAVKSRVDGQVVKVSFEEGQDVKAG